MHMIPMEHPNKNFPSPPPFMFHPELQPDLAATNPTNLAPLTVYRRKINSKAATKAKLGCSAVSRGQEKRFEMPQGVGPRTLMRAPALYEYKRPEYKENLEPFQDELTEKAKHYFLNEDDKPEKLIG